MLISYNIFDEDATAKAVEKLNRLLADGYAVEADYVTEHAAAVCRHLRLARVSDGLVFTAQGVFVSQKDTDYAFEEWLRDE